MAGVQVASLYAKITLQNAGAIAGLKQMQTGIGAAANNLKNMRDQARTTGLAMTAGITAPLLLLGKTAISTAADYQTSMIRFQAITNATAGEMDTASKLAMKFGNDITLPGISAADTGTALLGLASGGITNANEAMKALHDTLLLSAASGISSADSANIMSAALNTYGMKASEAAKITDLFVAASLRGGQGVDSINQAFTNAAPAWTAAKVPIADLMTSIALLGQQGIKGAPAGTALSAMMKELMAPTDQAVGALKTMGVQVYNADGSFKSFGELMPQISSSLAGFTDAQRNTRLATLFSSDAMVAAQKLFGPAASGYNDLKDAVTKSGVAQNMATAQSQGIAGAWKQMQAAGDTLLTTVVLPLAPAIAGVSLGIATLLTVVMGANPAVLAFAEGFVGVLAAVGPVLLLISSPFLGALTALAVPLLALGVTAGLLAVAWATNFGGIRDKTAELWSYLQPVFSELGRAAVQAFDGDWGGALTTLKGVWDKVWPDFVGKLGEIKDNLIGWVGDVTPGVVGKLGEWKAAFVNWLPGAWDGLVKNLGAVKEGVWGFVSTNGPILLGQLGTWKDAFVNWLPGAWSGLLTNLGAVKDGVWTFITTNGPLLLTKLGEWGSAFIDWVSPLISALVTKLIDVKDAVVGWVGANAGPVYDALVNNWTPEFLTWAKGVWSENNATLNTITDAVAGWAGNVGYNAMKGALEKLKGAGGDAAKAVGDAFTNGLADAFSSQNANKTITAGLLVALDPGAIPLMIGQNVAGDIAKGFQAGMADPGNFATIANGFTTMLMGPLALIFGPDSILVKTMRNMLLNAISAGNGVSSGGRSGGGGTLIAPDGTRTSVPAFAGGGIVTSPTLAMIGESGPEAVVPLNGGRGGLGGNITVQVTGNVYGVSDLEDVVVQAITKAQQRGRLSSAF